MNRLSCMSAAEVIYRFEQVCVGHISRFGLVSKTVPQPVRNAAVEMAMMPKPEGIESAPYVEEADAILAGNVILFAARRFDVGNPPSWNRDPLTGVVGPSVASSSISITDRTLVGDIKHVWELNRHLHLVRLAQAYILTGEPRFLEGLACQLKSWLEQCPPLIGPNWTSSLEAGIRLINWSLIWQIVGGWEGDLFKGSGGGKLREAWLSAIFAHCQFIRRHLSRHSSANNHLIGELAGLYMAARSWPYWQQSTDWAAQAKRELERELVLQHSTDGVNREQAFAYQVFTAEFLLVAGIYGQRSGDAFSDGYWEGIERALCFLRSVRDVGGHLPNVGDADDGIVWRLEPGETGNRPAMLLALGDAVFKFDQAASSIDSVRWLIGTSPSPVTARQLGVSRDWRFPDGGYFLFGSQFGGADEIKGLVDCGNLGYLGIAAHGHADALALTLSICGEECLIDPGTFSYWNELKWRDYFRGTSAHNTLRVDGMDQSVSGGRFMWTRKAKARVERAPDSPSEFGFAGSHDGYMRLADPVRHLRRIQFNAGTKILLVRDEINGNAIHEIEQFWHFAPGLAVEMRDRNVVVTGKRFRLSAQFSGSDLSLALSRGSEYPLRGWCSRGYESKEPCTTLAVSLRSSAAAIAVRFDIELMDAELATKRDSVPGM